MINNNTPPGRLKVKNSTIWNLSESYFDWGGKVYKVTKIDNLKAIYEIKQSKTSSINIALKILTLPLIGLFALGFRTYYRWKNCTSYENQSPNNSSQINNIFQTSNPSQINNSSQTKSINTYNSPLKSQTNCIKGTMSQFTEKFDRAGASACTPMSVKAAEMLLEKNDWSEISSEDLDGLIPKGIKLYKEFHPMGNDQYTSSDAVFDKLQDTKLKRALNLNGEIVMYQFNNPKRAVSCQGNLNYLINRILENQHTSFPCALILTCHNITTTLIIRSSSEFWFYDPHGIGANPVVAFIEKFNTKNSLLEKMSNYFYYVDFTKNDDMSDKNKSYESLPNINTEDLNGLQRENLYTALILEKK